MSDVLAIINKINQKGKASQKEVKLLEAEILQNVEFSAAYIQERDSTFLVFFQGTPFAGISEKANYADVYGFGNFKKVLSPTFWGDLNNKLALSSGKVVATIPNNAPFTSSKRLLELGEKMANGSSIAKSGFKAEQILTDFLNSPDGPDCLSLHNICPKNEIKNIKAERLVGRKKTDVRVSIEKTNGEVMKINLSVKKSTADFSQLERGDLEKYRQLLNMPDKVYNLLKFFLGKSLPSGYDSSKTFRETHRLFLDELTDEDQKSIIDFFDSIKKDLIHNAFLGTDPESRPHFLVTINKEDPIQSDFKEAKFTAAEKAITIALDTGKVLLSPRGSLKIGKITLQRKGGDGGKPKACDIQIKFNPSDYHE